MGEDAKPEEKPTPPEDKQKKKNPFDKEKQPLLAALWHAEVLKDGPILERLKKIKPDDPIKVVRFTKEGKPDGTAEITGARLMDSAALVLGYANKGKLKDDDLKVLNKALYSQTETPDGDTEEGKKLLVSGLEKVKKAFLDVNGDTAYRKGVGQGKTDEKNTEEKKADDKKMQSALQALDKLNKLLTTTDSKSDAIPFSVKFNAADHILERELAAITAQPTPKSPAAAPKIARRQTVSMP